jgi:hypothetical protein
VRVVEQASTANFIPARDMDAMLALRAAVWGKDHPHNDARFFEWLFADDDAPAKGIVTRDKDGKVVGFGCLCLKRLLLDGRTVKVAHGLDYMAHPGLPPLSRSREAVRVATHWLELARRVGSAVAVSYPNENSNRLLISKRVQLQPLFSPALLVRPLLRAKPAAPLHPRVPRWLSTAALRAAALASEVVRGGQRSSDAAVEEIGRFGFDADDLWNRASRGLKVALVRDARYLNWRYRDHPLYRYDAYAARRDATLDGILVATTREVGGLHCYLIVDALVDRWSNDTVTALCDAVVARARARGADVVGALAASGSDFYRVLRKQGFFPLPERLSPKEFNASGTVFLDSAASALNPAAWHFAWGDTDVV